MYAEKGAIDGRRNGCSSWQILETRFRFVRGNEDLCGRLILDYYTS